MSLMPKIANIPLMLHSDYAEALFSNDLEQIEKRGAAYKKAESNLLSVKDSSVAIIQVYGPLSQKEDFWSWLFGGTSYDQIRSELESALNNDEIESILFDIDSPGGNVAGVFDLVDEIYESRSKKPSVAIINEIAYSAAYAIASAANEIYIPRTGGVGSIGVIAVHTDQSKFDEKLGVKYTPIFAGEKKNDFSTHEPLSADAYKSVKAEIDEIYDLFVTTVADNRNISAQRIRDMEAALFQGQKAVDAGLADGVKTYKQILEGGIVMSLLEKVTNAFKDAKPEEIEQTMAGFGYVLKAGTVSQDELTTQLETQAAKHKAESEDAVKKATDEGLASGKEAAKKAVISILELCSVAGKENLGMQMIAADTSEEDARKQLIQAKTDESTEQTINSMVNPVNTGEVNPLLADAEKRAKEVK